jgi:LmbE family N-acetylglucosaminyl deacetylase
MSKKAMMAVGAHADDIENNTAGTLLKYHDLGYKIVYVMATNNMAGCDKRRRTEDNQPYYMPPRECYEVRRREATSAAKCFGTEPVFLDHPQGAYHKEGQFRAVELKYKTNMPEGFPEDIPCIINACRFKSSVGKLKDLILKEDPEFIFTHSIDYNPEHNGTALLTVNAYRQAHNEGYRGILLAWVSQQRYDFKMAPDVIVDISEYIDKKIEVQLLHASQAEEIWPERFRATAKFWGKWSYNCKGEYGEAFKTIRIGSLF